MIIFKSRPDRMAQGASANGLQNYGKSAKLKAQSLRRFENFRLNPVLRSLQPGGYRPCNYRGQFLPAKPKPTVNGQLIQIQLFLKKRNKRDFIMLNQAKLH